MHVNVMSGEWTEPYASIGGGLDSFYEYLFKSFVLFGDDIPGFVFLDAYEAIVQHARHPSGWYLMVDMHTGDVSRASFSSLEMFWPGLQIMLGDAGEALGSLRQYASLLDRVKFQPEAMMLQTGGVVPGQAGYPLRPELAESILQAFILTGDEKWLRLGITILDRLEELYDSRLFVRFSRAHNFFGVSADSCKVECGVASIADVLTLTKENKVRAHFSFRNSFSASTLDGVVLSFRNTKVSLYVV